jgi:putative acetyltransferase
LILIRTESPTDAAALCALISAAFERAPHRSGTEASIVEALRAAGALTISLVAVEHDEIVGHAAFSPVTINGEWAGWFGLGPVAVRPDRQRNGLGQALISCGLDRLRNTDAAGCVVLGDPRYYRRFGFVSDPALRYGNVRPEFFQRLLFKGVPPKGEVAYHQAFDAA